MRRHTAVKPHLVAVRDAASTGALLPCALTVGPGAVWGPKPVGCCQSLSRTRKAVLPRERSHPVEAATFKPPSPFYGVGGEWTVDLAGRPEGVEEDGQPPGEGNDDGVVFSRATLQLRFGPAAEVGIGSAVAEGEVGGLDKEGAEIRVALFGDRELRVMAAGLVTAWDEAKVGTDVAAAAEAS